MFFSFLFFSFRKFSSLSQVLAARIMYSKTKTSNKREAGEWQCTHHERALFPQAFLPPPLFFLKHVNIFPIQYVTTSLARHYFFFLFFFLDTHALKKTKQTRNSLIAPSPLFPYLKKKKKIGGRTTNADENEEDGTSGRKVGSLTRIADRMMSGYDALVVNVRQRRVIPLIGATRQ